MHKLLLAALAASLAILACRAVAAEVSLHVSPNGDDANPGTKAKPVRTLEAARDALRRLRAEVGGTRPGATVWLLPGRYERSAPFTLGPLDSGTASRPVVYRGVDRDRVILSGGTRLDATAFRPVTNQALLARLNPAARGKVCSAKLEGKVWAELFPGKGEYGLLSFNGHVLQVAQWPNRGYHHIRKVLDKGPTRRWLKPGEKPAPWSEANPTGGRFTMREARDADAWAREFDRTGDMLVEGYLHNDWYFQRERVGRIRDDVIQLLHHTRYGVEARLPVPRRVRVIHVLCELDQPGEWYFDRAEGRLYLWPSAPLDDKASLVAPGGTTLIQLDKTKHVTIRDLTIENAGNLAVSVKGGRENTIGGCVVRNGVGRGIEIEGGRKNGVTGCDLYGLETALKVSGGDRKTLTSCENYVVNCDIHRCRKKGYGAVGLEGVGLRFAHNLIHDMNGAVLFNSCNDLVMEFNEFYNMGWEMGDWNVAYCGAQWWTYGNVLRFNFVHHLMEMPQAYPVGAFRGDDGDAGTTFTGNVFYKAGRYAVASHGPGNRIVGNIVLDTHRAWSSWIGPTTPEDIRKAWDKLKPYDRGQLLRGDKGDYLWRTEQIVGKAGWTKPPWSTKYPLFKSVMATNNPWAQTWCEFRANYGSGVTEPIYVHRGSPASLPESCAWEKLLPIDPREAFVDPDSLNFALRPSFRPAKGFVRIPFEKIGLRKDAYRPNPPDKAVYRRAIRQRYQGVKSHGGRYNPDTINRRYPLPAYLADEGR